MSKTSYWNVIILSIHEFDEFAAATFESHSKSVKMIYESLWNHLSCITMRTSDHTRYWHFHWPIIAFIWNENIMESTINIKIMNANFFKVWLRMAGCHQKNLDIGKWQNVNLCSGKMWEKNITYFQNMWYTIQITEIVQTEILTNGMKTRTAHGIISVDVRQTLCRFPFINPRMTMKECIEN